MLMWLQYKDLRGILLFSTDRTKTQLGSYDSKTACVLGLSHHI